MNKKDYAAASIEKLVSDAAYQALEAGKGSRAYGAGNGIEVDNEYKLLKIDYRESLFPPRDMDDEEFNALPEKSTNPEDITKEKVGVKRGWFEFITNNGAVSFAAIMGDKDMYSDEFWKDAKNKVDDFDVKNIFHPTSRTPEAWIKSGCDGLLGKTLRCVATREYNLRGFGAKARAFVVVD